MTEDHGLGEWRKRRAQLAGFPGVRTLRRRLPDGRELPLGYARNGSGASVPVLVLPGGPGMASVAPYRAFRAAAVKRGLDVLMVEHRGIGMSRRTDDGAELDPGDVTVTAVLDDLAAVLDAEGVERVVVYGSSYGSYLAGAFGTRHPDRVAGMVLDSAVTGAATQRVGARVLNELYWHGTPATRRPAARLRALVERGELEPRQAGFAVRFLHEYGGPDAVDTLFGLLERGRGRRLWAWVQGLGTAEVTRVHPFLLEFDLVGRVAFTELDYGTPHDDRHGPLAADDPFAELAHRYPPFAGDPYDIPAALPGFSWPVLALSGDRDVRSPRVTAEETVARAPNAALVRVRQHGHSALDTARGVALSTMRHAATQGSRAPAVSPREVTAPRPVMGRLLAARLGAARLLPRALS